jgi:hypothetical protein
MKNNINNNPSLSSISLAQFSVDNHFDGKFSFNGRFFLGRKKGEQELYGGEFIATDATFNLSEDSLGKLNQFITSLENDLAIYLFEETKEEKQKEKDEILEDGDDTFLI